MRAAKKARWGLWAETDNEGRVRFYEVVAELPPPGYLPREAEVSPDGNWATLYVNGKPVRTWMRLID
jgi:hypothetical protein